MTRFAGVLVLAFLAPVIFSSNVLAQQAELDALAGKVAQKISQKHRDLVTVADFTLENRGGHPLASAVTSEFKASLQRVAPNVHFIESAAVDAVAQKFRVLPVDASNSALTLAVAAAAGAETGVTGSIELQATALKLEIVVADLKDRGDPFDSRIGHQIGKFQTVLPLSPEWSKMTSQPSEQAIGGIYPFFKGIGLSGPEYPKCPTPGFTDAARANKTQGIVLLVLTVNATGDAQDLIVLKHPGDGLAQAALNAVRKWKFKPARLHDGTPVSARVMIEVSFRFQ